jgi:hypothetical protein
MPGRGAARWALVALLPVLLAAADPSGDVAGCRGGPGSGAPDLVEARGEILEQGTSARWTLTFAAPLEVPDRNGHPFRVDVAIRDPDVPALSFAYFRGVNRLVRVDATVEHPTQILLLPEAGASVFNPAVVEGRTMTIQVPGRTLSADEDLTGTSPGLEALRWTVVVRDERACDVLGTGRPTERLRTFTSPPAEDLGSPSIVGALGAWLVAPAIAVVVLTLAVVYLVRRRSR